jgi:hypothetical protein
MTAQDSPPPREARTTTLHSAISIGLDECLIALSESFSDLTDQEFWAEAVKGRHNIVTLVEHCIQGLDLYACEVQGIPLTFEPDKRFDIGPSSQTPSSQGMPVLPTVTQVQGRVAELRQAIMAQLCSTPEDTLPTQIADCWWYDDQPDKTRADAYMRCIWHTMAHVRQIWLLRGALGCADSGVWPRQHWA